MNDTTNDATQCFQYNTAAQRSNPFLDAEVLNNVEEMELCGEEDPILADIQLCANFGGIPRLWIKFGEYMTEKARAKLKDSVECSMHATNPDRDVECPRTYENNDKKGI